MKGDAQAIAHLQAQLRTDSPRSAIYYVHYACSSTGVSTGWRRRYEGVDR